VRVFFTDGSASPNPGPGGYAVIENGQPVALGSEDGQTTNIRMEGLALIAAMELAGDEPCEIHSDSEFWINVLTKWAPGWAAKGWRKKGGEIKNLDIVKPLFELPEKTAALKPADLNEICKKYARKEKSTTIILRKEKSE